MDNHSLGVLPSAAVLAAELEPALSEAEGDIARIVTVPNNLHHDTDMPNSPANGTSRHL